MKIRNIFYFMFYFVTLLLAVDVSYSCSSIFECLEQGNYNVGDWTGAVQFQLLSLFVILILVTILFKQDLEDRFHMQTRTANMVAWLCIIALLFTVSLSQQNGAILRFVFLIAVVPLFLLAFIVAKKVKGEDNSWLSTPGYTAIALGIYVFIRLVTIFFGNVDILEVIPLIGFIAGFTLTNFLDIIIVGAILFLRHKHEQETSGTSSNTNLGGLLQSLGSLRRNSATGTTQPSNTNLASAQNQIKYKNNSKIVDVVIAQHMAIETLDNAIKGIKDLQSKYDSLDEVDVKKIIGNISSSVIKDLEILSKIKVSGKHEIIGDSGGDKKKISFLLGVIERTTRQLNDASKDEIEQKLNGSISMLNSYKVYVLNIDYSMYSIDELRVIVKDIGSYIITKHDYNQVDSFLLFCNQLFKLIQTSGVQDNFQNFLILAQRLPNETIDRNNHDLIIQIINSS